MKKRLLHRILVVICILSVSMNIVSYVRNDAFKKKNLLITYTCLGNISAILGDYKHDIESRNLTNNLDRLLEGEFWKLDLVLDNLNTLFGTPVEGRYSSIFISLMQQKKACDDEDFIIILAQYQEIFDEALLRLSNEVVANANENEEHIKRPNSALSAYQIAHILNNSLAQIGDSNMNQE